MPLNRQPTAGLLALAGGVALLVVTGPQGAEPPPQQPAAAQPAAPPRKLTAEEYRRLYPFESLAGRLAYEEEPAAELRRAGNGPPLSAEARGQLDAADRPHALRVQDLRRKTLEILHSDEAQKFIDREGFGVSRMPRPSLFYLDLPPAPAIPFGKRGTALDSDRETAATLGAGSSDGRMPSLDLLGTFHQLGGRDNFASPASLGFVKDRGHVAGFQSHRFRRMPALGDFRPGPKGGDAAKETWLVTRLELVSLLRPLSEFEGRGLGALRAGEDVMTEATTNHIRMLGALRASAQCLDCHQVRRGDLLGAFSYDLQRDPPRVEKPARRASGAP